jgi:hypothetical protein
MPLPFRQEYANVFRLRRRVITRVKRLTKPLLNHYTDGSHMFTLTRPARLRNIVQAWNAENETTSFKIKGYTDTGVTICNDEDETWSEHVAFENIPLEDLIRLENFVYSRREKGYDVPFKMPKLKLVCTDDSPNIRGQSIHTDGPSPVAGKRIMTIGRWRGTGFFYFKRDDVRLCAYHSAPFQPLQPALNCGEFGDGAARCPWCPGGELAPYWRQFKTTHQRMALMDHLNKLLPDLEQKEAS